MSSRVGASSSQIRILLRDIVRRQPKCSQTERTSPAQHTTAGGWGAQRGLSRTKRSAHYRRRRPPALYADRDPGGGVEEMKPLGVDCEATSLTRRERTAGLAT